MLCQPGVTQDIFHCSALFHPSKPFFFFPNQTQLHPVSRLGTFESFLYSSHPGIALVGIIFHSQ